MQDAKPTPQEEVPPAEPLVVAREPETGPLPVAPMTEGPPKEGRTAPEVPEWLALYADVADQKRAALSGPEQVLFDSYWRRATGEVRPALSGRERSKLLSYLD